MNRCTYLPGQLAGTMLNAQGFRPWSALPFECRIPFGLKKIGGAGMARWSPLVCHLVHERASGDVGEAVRC